MAVPRYYGIGLAAAVAVGASAAVAAAEPPSPFPECARKPTQQDIDGARGAHRAASQFYERGDYDKALRYWKDAFVFDCTANDLMLNIANAQEKMGDRAAAVVTLETYLQRTGSNPTLEERVANLKKSLAPAPTAPASATALPPSPPVSAAPTVPPPSQVPAAPPPSPAPMAMPVAVAPRTDSRPYGSSPWILVGVGAVGTIAGVILLPVGYSAISDAAGQCNASRQCPASTDWASKGNTGRAEVGTGWAAFGLGVAALGGGLG